MAASNRSYARPASYAPSPSRTKGMLFCPDCEHRSRFDGDWTVVETGHDSRYLCPDCGTEITVRPTFDAEGDRR